MDRHFTDPEFWTFFNALPKHIQALAVKNYGLLRVDPRHPALHFKRISSDTWSARVGLHYRALALELEDGFRWFWIGTHAEYDKFV